MNTVKDLLIRLKIINEEIEERQKNLAKSKKQIALEKQKYANALLNQLQHATSARDWEYVKKCRNEILNLITD